MGTRQRRVRQAPGRSGPGALLVWGLTLGLLLAGGEPASPSHADAPSRVSDPRKGPQRQEERQGQQAQRVQEEWQGQEERQGREEQEEQEEQEQEQEEQEEQEREEQEEQEAEPEPEPLPDLPDLRIVSIDVIPHPVPEGRTARVDVVLHNDGTRPAAGGIVVRAVHDRLGPLPVPGTAELLFLAADALETVSFELRDVRPGRSPYELVAAVDVLDDVDELWEDNNVAWRRLLGCPESAGEEARDGIDNDCDGDIDEDLPAPEETWRRLLEISEDYRRRERELIPLVFAVAEPLVPYGIEYRVRLRASTGEYVSAAGGGGGALSADRAEAAVWETFTLVDHDGGDLVSGDTVGLRTADGVHRLVAPGGGGSSLHARSGSEAGRARLFVLVRAEGEGSVTSGDRVFLRASSGHFVVAEGGGGGAVNADRPEPGPWETFVLEIPVEDEWTGR